MESKKITGNFQYKIVSILKNAIKIKFHEKLKDKFENNFNNFNNFAI